jgi:hypothetical protein
LRIDGGGLKNERQAGSCDRKPGCAGALHEILRVSAATLRYENVTRRGSFLRPTAIGNSSQRAAG